MNLLAVALLRITVILALVISIYCMWMLIDIDADWRQSKED